MRPDADKTPRLRRAAMQLSLALGAPRQCFHLADPDGAPQLLCGQSLDGARLGFAFAELDENSDMYALAIADASGKPAEACERCLALASIPAVSM